MRWVWIFAAMAAVGIVVAGCGGATGEDDCLDDGACSYPNDNPVPDVVGETPREACRILESKNYNGVILRAKGGSNGSGPSHVVAQDPKAGFEGGRDGQGIRLTVSGSVSQDDPLLDRNCILATQP